MDSLDARDLKGDSTDKIVEGGICGKERPDRIYDLGDKIIVLECDEHQHRETRLYLRTNAHGKYWPVLWQDSSVFYTLESR
jgi:hypothetical protein